MGKGQNVGTRPYSLQELEQMGRCRTEPAEGSELPTVSGAGAEPEAARLASVSRAASSQEPEPGPGERKSNPKGEIPDQGSLPPPKVASALPTCPLGSCRTGSLTITGLGLQLLLATQGLLICFLLLRQLAFCSPRGEGRGQSGGG